jgi:hypothetical protein
MFAATSDLFLDGYERLKTFSKGGLSWIAAQENPGKGGILGPRLAN